MGNYQILLSEEMVSKAQLGEDTSLLRRELFYMKQSRIDLNLDTDELKKIFWTNIYNAFILININDTLSKKLIFKRKRIKIARNILSLDEIEYGILRMYKYKVGFFYINSPFYSSFIKKNAIAEVDYKIKSGLNSRVVKSSKIVQKETSL